MNSNDPPTQGPGPQGPKRSKKKKQRHPAAKWALRLGVACLIVLSALGVGGGAALLTVYRQLPDVRQLENYTLPMATEIYTQSGKMLTRISAEGRYDPIPIDELPQHVQDAVISAEDRRFWQHEGVDYLGLARAIYINLKRGEGVMGASTITQQLIKNLILTNERTAKRKIAEALLAFELENTYSKHQILEMYLNLVFLGHNVYGVEAASQIYYGKSARNISIAEAALLAGIIRSPEYYSPYHRPDKANQLKEIVLKQMQKDGRITAEQLEQALQEQIKLVGLRTAYPHPYFLDYVMATLRERYGPAPFRQGGWKVYTTIDPGLQAYGEQLLQQHLPRLKRSGAEQAALVAMDPRNGFIKTMVGGVNYANSQFNRAFQAQRQVGSTFKPFVYLTAFEQGMTLQDQLKDQPTSFGGYRPRNWDRRYRGDVSLLQGLTWSINIPTVKLAQKMGIGNVIQTARRAGVRSPINADLTAALGASEMNLVELTGAYSTFAHDGVLVTPTAITKIVDHDGKTLWEYFPPHRRVFSQGAIDQLNYALKNVVQAGTGTGARIGRPAAGKTGTTDRAYDTWFVGYVPQMVTGVWAGNDKPSATRGGGGSTCAPIWRQFMLRAMQGLPVEDFDMPVIEAKETPSPDPDSLPDPSATTGLEEIPLESVNPEGPSLDHIPSDEQVNPFESATPRPVPTESARPAPTPSPTPTPEMTPLPLPSLQLPSREPRPEEPGTADSENALREIPLSTSQP